MKLYTCLGSGNCFKPWLVAQQTGQDMDVTLIDVLTGEQKSPAYQAINPLGVVPYLIAPDGRAIGESNAMTWFLAENTALMPASPTDRAEALQWMFFEQARLEPFISPARFLTTILPGQRGKRADDILRWQREAAPGLAHLDRHLNAREFILGQGYSVADIAVFGYVHLMDEAGIAMADFPNIERWVGAVEATQAYRPISDMSTELRQAA